MMRQSLKRFGAAIRLGLGGTGAASAQFLIRVDGGDQTMTVTTGVPGGALLPVVNTSSTLRYRQWFATTKITVSTVCPGQNFSLSVVATGVPIGTPAPEVPLVNGMFDTDFITDIPPGILRLRRCTLRYTGSAGFDQGNSLELGNDVHNVTYTIVAQ
jgi:hypothetical protein